jgi:signal transduction histidine kinase
MTDRSLSAYAAAMEEARAWLRRWWDSPTRDVVFALAMTALLVAGSYGEAHPIQPGDQVINGHPVPHTPDAAYLLVAVACLVLAFRRRWPAAVLVTSTVAVAVYSLPGYVNGAALLAPYCALYAFATQVSVRRAIAWAAGMLAVLMLATASANRFTPIGGGFGIMPFVAAAACFAGIAVGNRRAYVASIKERAEADARRQIDEERLRIARELHDVVAHTMATINVQASAAAQVLRDRPGQAAESLGAIRAASKDGLRELRAILNVLRHADEAADPTWPVPGLARLDALAEGARAAGLPVTVTVTGQPGDLPAVTDVAAFRIIQEALTNTIRHAGPATAAVAVRDGGGDLEIEVTDTGRGPAASAVGGGRGGAGPGHGLRGMRERAAAAGGTLEIGPGPAGGFRVAARFPLEAPAGPDVPAASAEPGVLR